ncbi:MAG TPA: TlpA disulfide reductase family protein [Acidobacteriota bacterium]|nr:TlpA disulfide reductase family protein [Acidobacteriota bacterium]
MRSFVRVAAVFSLLYLLVLSLSASSLNWIPADERQSIDLSKPLLRTLEGEELTLEEMDAEVLLINFWATWCSPCRKEMPDLEKLQKMVAEDGIRVVALSDDDPEDVRAYLEKHSYDFPFLIDKNSDLYLSMEFPGGVLPVSMVVDKQGRVALVHIGVYKWDAPEVVASLRELARQ